MVFLDLPLHDCTRKKSEELPFCFTNNIHIHSFDIPKPPLLPRNFICSKNFSHFLYAVSNAGFKKYNYHKEIVM